MIFIKFQFFLATVQGHCLWSDGWKKFDGSCYKLFRQRRDWTGAKEVCEKKNATLAMAKSNSSYNFLAANFEYNNVSWIWLGGYKRQDPSPEWIWLDGSKLADHSTTTNWGSAQPDDFNGRQNCLTMKNISAENRIVLDDMDCRNKSYFFCEYKSNGTIFTDKISSSDNKSQEYERKTELSKCRNLYFLIIDGMFCTFRNTTKPDPAKD